MSNRTRGVRQTVPGGTVIANIGSKPKQPSPVDIRKLVIDAAGSYVASKIGSAVAAIPGGFGFSVGGAMSDGEILGFGMLPTAITFTNGDADTEVISEYAANASSVLHLQTLIAAVYTTVGTITFSAAGTSGVVAWTSSPYTLPAFTPLSIRAPSPADLTLAWLTGTLSGATS